jgi:hypothetical protein
VRGSSENRRADNGGRNEFSAAAGFYLDMSASNIAHDRGPFSQYW